MPALHGKGGDVVFAALDDAFGNATATIISWTFTSSSDTARATGMSASFDTFLPGLDTFTATTEVVATTTLDLPADIGAEGTLELYVSSGDQNCSANAICTSITETCSIDDVGRVTMTFEGDADSVVYPS